jgi:hypothetical protein
MGSSRLVLRLPRQREIERASDQLPIAYLHIRYGLSAQPLSLRFKHESFGLDIKPLAKLPLPLSS